MQVAELDKTYDPKVVEDNIYRYWVDGKHFRATPAEGKEPFTIVIPPPNITGSLHMGHALDNTIQDVLTRYHRMLGKVACWVPGTDHAGIATQRVVEKQLLKEGKSRHDLGREAFIARVWTWREQYGDTIVGQLKRLGVSCDWDRQAFTMDAARSKAVRECFVQLYEKGDIYRGKRLVNWCPHCLTALSDLEVEHETSQGSLYHLGYPLVGQEGSLVIATTRPETILADAAVAVNPNDERYKHLIGKFCRIPIADREIPIIADEAVETEFGTGALKITPAHDAVDFEVGQRHGLPQLVCIDEHGKLNELGLHLKGMDRFVARKQIVKELEEQGFLLEVKPHENNLGVCYRCNTVLEPSLSDQWWMSMERLAKPSIAGVKNGDVRFVPERFAKQYLSWMEGIRDWCLSRQIWWGHRIPVWTCEACNHREAHREDPTKCPACASSAYQQDPDVLDTWFSSGLWPLAVFGWPEETRDLEFFYPTSVLVTGRDIIYLWVARMIMFGYEFRGKKPYSDVLIHATIMTADGKRMSKSLGTGVDPLELIDEFGADATRFALMIQATHSQDIRHNKERYEMGRNFCNKIWNAVRLCLRLFPAGLEPTEAPVATARADEWILFETEELVRKVGAGLASYDFDEASRQLYEFFWNKLCDWYLEMIKPVFYGRSDAQEQRNVSTVLLYALDRFLRVSHPIMPFLTEEIWHHLPGTRGPLILAPYPVAQVRQPTAVAEIELLQEVARSIRNLRAELSLQPKQKVDVLIEAPEPTQRALLTESLVFFQTMAGVARLDVQAQVDPRPTQALTQRIGENEIFLAFPEGFDASTEIRRLQAELAEAQLHLERIEKKLSNPGFTDKARPEVVAKERERQNEQRERLGRVNERLSLFKGEGRPPIEGGGGGCR